MNGACIRVPRRGVYICHTVISEILKLSSKEERISGDLEGSGNSEGYTILKVTLKEAPG